MTMMKTRMMIITILTLEVKLMSLAANSFFYIQEYYYVFLVFLFRKFLKMIMVFTYNLYSNDHCIFRINITYTLNKFLHNQKLAIDF